MNATRTKTQLKTLREAISNRPPYCSGICSVPAEQCLLFYRKAAGESAFCIDLLNVSASQLEQLSGACAPATFGVDQKDVLDESYRKAGKLDTVNFASKFNLERSGLLNVIHSELLEGHDGEIVEAELYKLNVYGKDSFFKSHKDTPRGEKMFGSLVIVFPTMHEGGALALRHEGEEWIFDPTAKSSDQSECSIAYVAFYGDIEHEVQIVKAGYQVTLTYNLYFAAKHPTSPIIPITSPSTAGFKDALSTLLADPEFFPEGGHLGFGLQHQYAINTDSKPGYLLNSLKGSDAVIKKANYMADDYSGRKARSIFSSEFVDLSRYDAQEDGDVTQLLVGQHGCQWVLSNNLAQEQYDSESAGCPESSFIRVWWVTTQARHTISEPYILYGNEHTLNYLYGNVCLVVHVGKPGQRSLRG